MRQQQRECMCRWTMTLAIALAAASGCMSWGPANHPADLGIIGLTPVETTEGTQYGLPPRQHARPGLVLPTSIMLVRVQGGVSCFNGEAGNASDWTVELADDDGEGSVRTESHMQRISALPLLQEAFAAGMPFARTGERMIDGLRRTAWQCGAGLILLYTFDTKVDESEGLPPFDLVTLGLVPDIVTEAETIAHAALIDTRTGYIYAVAHTDTETWQLASHWTTDSAGEDVLERAERRAFNRLMETFEKAWADVVHTYGQGR